MQFILMLACLLVYTEMPPISDLIGKKLHELLEHNEMVRFFIDMYVRFNYLFFTFALYTLNVSSASNHIYIFR